MDDIFDFKITNVSSKFKQDSVTYSYVKHSAESFVIQVSSVGGALLPDGCTEVDLTKECLDVNNYEVLEISVSESYQILSDSEPALKISDQVFKVPLWVDPERIDPDCPKTVQVDASDRAFTLAVGEKRVV